MKLFTIFLLAVLPAAASAQAPFCVVTGGGENCSYIDANVCRQVAASSNGMCVARAELRSQQQPQLLLPNAVDSYQRGAEFGQRQRIEREEHEARMRLLNAQAEAAKAPAPNMKQPSGYYTVNYDCTATDGSHYKSKMPIPGCVVVSIDFD